MALKRSARREQAATVHFNHRLAQFLGINRTDAHCLELIGQGGRITAGELARAAGLTTGAVTALVDRLERAGYVDRVRDREDRRKVWIAQSDHAERLLGALFVQFADIGAIILEQFSEGELAAIQRFLDLSAAITAARATLLQAHIPPAPATAAVRMRAARAFLRDTGTMTEKMRGAARRGDPVTQDILDA